MVGGDTTKDSVASPKVQDIGESQSEMVPGMRYRVGRGFRDPVTLSVKSLYEHLDRAPYETVLVVANCSRVVNGLVLTFFAQWKPCQDIHWLEGRLRY